MLEFINSETTIRFTLAYMYLFGVYHAFIFILWYFKKRAFKTFYPPALQLYTVVQGLGVVVGVLAHLIYLAQPGLGCITPRIVIFAGFVWLVAIIIGAFIDYREKIIGDY